MKKLNKLNTELCESNEPKLHELLEFISGKPGCLQVSALPDCYIKNNKYTTPSSVITVFKNYIIPQLLTKSINCGMGLVKFDITPSELITKQEDLIDNIHKMLREESIIMSKDLLSNIYDEGALAIMPALGIEKKENSELFSCAGSEKLNIFEKEKISLDGIIEDWIYEDSLMMLMPGNNFGGNHFIEWQRLGELLVGGHNKFDSKSTYCFYHFDSPITKVLSQNFERKNKNEEFTTIDLNSFEGQKFISSIRLGTNIGGAARLALVKLLSESINNTFRKNIDWNIIWDGGHSTFQAANYEDSLVLVSRKGCVNACDSPYGVIAGNYNTPSIIVGRKQNLDFKVPWLNSYDHGTDYHLWRDNKKGVKEEKLGEVTCYTLPDKDAVWETRAVKKELVYIGPAIKHVLEVYNTHKSSPVKPLGLLYPIINYKLDRKTY